MAKRAKTDSTNPNRRRFRLCDLLVIKLKKETEVLYVRDDDFDLGQEVGAEHLPLVDELGELRREPPLSLDVRELPKAEELRWKRINVNMIPKAFTLVEIMIVIAAIAVLTSLAIPGYVSVMKTRRASACGANLQLIEAAKQSYWVDTHQNPPTDPNDPAGIRLYLAGGLVPTCPASGTYSNTTTLNLRCACSLVNTPENPDFGRAGALITTNGYHNVGY